MQTADKTSSTSGVVVRQRTVEHLVTTGTIGGGGGIQTIIDGLAALLGKSITELFRQPVIVGNEGSRWPNRRL